MTFRFRALVEDRGHEALLRGLLDQSSSASQLRVEPYPQGRGAGEQHVRKHLPAFVKDLRTKKNQQGLWGIVVADGDVVGFAGRRAVLMAELTTANLSPLTSADRVLLLLPTRNVETWAWCILGNAVDETTDFKDRLAEANLRKTFSERWLPPQPTEPQSLVAGRSEWPACPRGLGQMTRIAVRPRLRESRACEGPAAHPLVLLRCLRADRSSFRQPHQ